jgi:hypothetical protein
VAQQEGLGEEEVTGDIRARTRDALGELTDALHDLWFTVDDIAFHEERREVVVPIVLPAEQRGRFGWRSIVKGTDPAGTLVVSHVARLDIHDEAGVGDYELNYLEATDAEQQAVVRLHATIPLRVDLYVDEIDVEFVPARRTG